MKILPSAANRADRSDADAEPLYSRRQIGVWIFILFCTACLIHMLLPSFFDGDTGYHIAVARMTAKHGILHRFPWTPFSWTDEHYADREFLFHMLLVPIAHLDPYVVGRIAGIALSTALLATLFLLLVRERVDQAGFWTLLALGSSSAFIARFACVRPHMISIPLALVIVWAAARRRTVPLIVLAVLYPLCYTAWHLPVILVGIAEFAHLVTRRRISFKIPALVLAGLALGIALNPNFPANLELFWIQNYQVLFGTAWSGKGGFDIGGEFRPFSLKGLARYVLLPGAIAIAALVQSVRHRHRDVLPLCAAIAAVSFLCITLLTQRFIEYLAPFAVFAAGLAWRAPRFRYWVPLLLLLGVVNIWVFGQYPIKLMLLRNEPFPGSVAEVLRMLIPEGEQVVTCDWRLTGEMMLALPERRFVVAMDPVFFAVKDPEKHRLWYEVVRNPPERPALLIRDAFDTRVVMCGEKPEWQRFFNAMDRDPNARLYGRIGSWRIYVLRPKEAGSGS